MMIDFTYRPGVRPDSLCQLADRWRGDALPIGGSLIEQKLDGWRFLWIDGKPFTRNGMPYRGIGHIERAMAVLQAQFDVPMFFDGEYIIEGRGDTLAATKAHQDNGWKGGDAGKVYLFDCLPMSDWHSNKSETPLYERKKMLKGGIVGMQAGDEAWEMGWTDGEPCPVEYMPDDWAATAGCVRDMAQRIWSAGGEGCVLKDAESPYRRNRNANWLKVKRAGVR